MKVCVINAQGLCGSEIVARARFELALGVWDFVMIQCEVANYSHQIFYSYELTNQLSRNSTETMLNRLSGIVEKLTTEGEFTVDHGKPFWQFEGYRIPYWQFWVDTSKFDGVSIRFLNLLVQHIFSELLIQQ